MAIAYCGNPPPWNFAGASQLIECEGAGKGRVLAHYQRKNATMSSANIQNNVTQAGKGKTMAIQYHSDGTLNRPPTFGKPGGFFQAPEIAAANKLNAATAKRQFRILVAEDDPQIRELNVGSLALAGFEVDCVQNGAAGWHALHLKRYDLLVTDNQMPKLSGVELIGKMRKAGINLAVILASGSLPSKLWAESEGLNIAARLPKPFTCDELVEAANRILRGPGSTTFSLTASSAGEPALAAAD
jgi:CheY-like chemotaxis protein